MKAKELTNLYWFCLAVENGGFAAASLKTKVSAPTLSRAVSQLEEQVGEKLVHRNAKQFQLTIAGEEYYQRFSSIFKQLNEQWLQLSNTQAELTGEILISCPEPFADHFLQQLAIEFMELHPGVRIHIKFASDTDRFIDDQIDLAVVNSAPKALHLVQRQLFKSPLNLAASPAYIKKHGEPKTVEDLLNHRLLVGNTSTHWEFRQDNQTVRIPVAAAYSVNSLRLAIQAACSGAGICLAPKAMIDKSVKKGELVKLLTHIESPQGNCFMVWADRKLIPARVQAFRDMVFERMGQPTKIYSKMAEKKSDKAND